MARVKQPEMCTTRARDERASLIQQYREAARRNQHEPISARKLGNVSSLCFVQYTDKRFACCFYTICSASVIFEMSLKLLFEPLL